MEFVVLGALIWIVCGIICAVVHGNRGWDGLGINSFGQKRT